VEIADGKIIFNLVARRDSAIKETEFDRSRARKRWLRPNDIENIIGIAPIK
jgi:hypothetical protein